MQSLTENSKPKNPIVFTGFFPSESNHCSECNCKIEDKDDGVFVFGGLHCFFCAQVK
jgi:hypothetical protein